MRWSRAARILFIAGVAAIAVWIGSHPGSNWRAEAWTSKIRGELPELAWSDLVLGMAPKSGVFGAETFRHRTGLVTFSRADGEQPCPAQWETPMGKVWGRAGDEPLLEFLTVEQLIRRIYDPRPHGIQHNDVVLDVGSHLGTFTHYSLSRGAALVVAFEPDPVNAACFKKTFAKQIGENRVVLVEAAAWRSTGTVNFASSQYHSGTGHVNEGGDQAVKAVTIDHVVQQLGLSQVDFIKMDIEGGERDALAGATETLARFGPRMAICVYHRKDDPEVVPRIALKAHPAYRMETTAEQAYFY